MSQLRRPLEFGSFLTPSAAAPTHVVELAVLAERCDLRLVSFQDHPYQPAFLDSWTLLSFVAARTSSVVLSSNVTNLPLRPPAMIARAGASLDLLSGGRFALALGSGAFWPGIVAMGGPARTSSDAVTALDEAVTVVRELWNTARRDPASFDGRFYRLSEAKRGPAPAHDVPIWLGAYKARGLRMIGTRADGWLPTLSYLDSLDAIDDANAMIDHAAREAGRDPAGIRRMLNLGPDSAHADTLAHLATERGIDTFVLMTDDPDQIRRFGQDTAPATRALITGS
jgi:alkanesulfonate monooxygenase SsuD/methylene tetrahydromethanopterin reductase-like flavin-dependent oxidoreductase (luciferase family)